MLDPFNVSPILSMLLFYCVSGLVTLFLGVDCLALLSTYFVPYFASVFRRNCSILVLNSVEICALLLFPKFLKTPSSPVNIL